MAVAADLSAYAAERGLALEARRELSSSVPRLSDPTNRYAESVAEGTLPGGLDGILLQKFSETADDDRATRRWQTVVLTQAPETIAFLPALALSHDRDPFGFRGPLLNASPVERVELESAEFNRRYRLVIPQGLGTAWVRELFSPSLIVWILNQAPDRLGFELVEGELAVAVPQRLADPEELDAFCEAAARVARTLRREGREEGGAAHDAAPSQWWMGNSEALARFEAAMSGREFSSYAEALRAWRLRMLTRARNWARFVLSPLLVVALVLGLIAGFGERNHLIGLAIAAIVLVALMLWLIWGWSRRVARVSFPRSYARTRGLTERTGRAFSAENPGLRIPGTPEHVIGGQLPGGIQGQLVLLVAGESGYGSVQKLWDAVVVADGGDGPAGGGGIEVVRGGGKVAAIRSTSFTERSAAGLDAFCLEVAERLGAGTADAHARSYE